MRRLMTLVMTILRSNGRAIDASLSQIKASAREEIADTERRLAKLKIDLLKEMSRD